MAACDSSPAFQHQYPCQGELAPLQPGTAAFSYHTRVPDSLQTPEALFDPVAAGIQGGLRLRHRGVGQQHPGLPLTIGVPHNQGGVQGRVTESLPGAHPQAARPRDQRAHGHAWGLTLGLKGDVGRVAQAGMPTQRVP